MSDCISAMYFYESGKCLLNRESRKRVGKQRFRRAGPSDGVVDYFETVCEDGWDNLQFS